MAIHVKPGAPPPAPGFFSFRAWGRSSPRDRDNPPTDRVDRRWLRRRRTFFARAIDISVRLTLDIAIQ
jgi:hypothetical protein